MTLNPTETSRDYLMKKIRKKGYRASKVVNVGHSSQYWIVYTSDKENKQRICRNAEWSLI